MEEGLSLRELAQASGHSRHSVKDALVHFGISIRDRDQSGQRRGQIPFGCRMVRGQLVKHKSERKVIDEMKAMRVAGGSFRKIAAAMRDRGVKTKNGGKWQASIVMKILKRSE